MDTIFLPKFILAHELVYGYKDGTGNENNIDDELGVRSRTEPINLTSLDRSVSPGSYVVFHVTYRKRDESHTRRTISDKIGSLFLDSLSSYPGFSGGTYNRELRHIVDNLGMLERDASSAGRWNPTRERFEQYKSTLAESPEYVFYSGLLRAVETMPVITATVDDAKRFIETQLRMESDAEFRRTTVKWDAMNERLHDIYNRHLERLPLNAADTVAVPV